MSVEPGRGGGRQSSSIAGLEREQMLSPQLFLLLQVSLTWSTPISLLEMLGGRPLHRRTARLSRGPTVSVEIRAKALVQEMGAAVFIVNSYMLFSEPKDHPDSLPDVLKAKNIQHESESHSRAIDLDDDNHHDALGDDTTHEDEVKEDDEEDADDHCLEGSPHGDQDQDGGSVDELKEAVTDGVVWGQGRRGYQSDQNK
ncbi:hypothetical protein BDK51DRAFT_32539 [Blyttiomyces helicus]|uniref:Uncharacterized protein n=1 Tax=Blyttiomyces helicus TaxID=388810 RepID=A0A4P9WH96_9FUNG|nr:hypothetical protein BDK51DRAFT_32539 [Blyttiomyces helicus]|eukprot:RKO90778.1 hypothetical protein BDK51DRAFT_32539 [Blyttiomyces helicus]